MRYQKPSTSIQEQLAIMRGRGLHIFDEHEASHYLKFIGYYRLSGYALSFQINNNQNGLHTFIPNAQFKQVVDLYQFDRRLRFITLDATEQIEILMRARIGYVLSRKFGSHWYLDNDPLPKK